MSLKISNDPNSDNDQNSADQRLWKGGKNWRNIN